MFLDLKPKRGVSISVSAIPFSATHSCPSTTAVDLAKKMRINMKLTLKTKRNIKRKRKRKVKRKVKGKMKKDRGMEMEMTRGYIYVYIERMGLETSWKVRLKLVRIILHQARFIVDEKPELQGWIINRRL